MAQNNNKQAIFQLGRLPSLPVCLVFTILTTHKVIWSWVPNCDSVHTWRFYTVALLGGEAAANLTRFHTQSHHLETELISLSYILIMPSVRLDSDKHQFCKSTVWIGQFLKSKHTTLEQFYWFQRAGRGSGGRTPSCKGFVYPIDPAQWMHLQFGIFSVATSGRQRVHQRLW